MEVRKRKKQIGRRKYTIRLRPSKLWKNLSHTRDLSIMKFIPSIIDDLIGNRKVVYFTTLWKESIILTISLHIYQFIRSAYSIPNSFTDNLELIVFVCTLVTPFRYLLIRISPDTFRLGLETITSEAFRIIYIFFDEYIFLANYRRDIIMRSRESSLIPYE